jgi:hypothetical protein
MTKTSSNVNKELAAVISRIIDAYGDDLSAFAEQIIKKQQRKPIATVSAQEYNLITRRLIENADPTFKARVPRKS